MEKLADEQILNEIDSEYDEENEDEIECEIGPEKKLEDIIIETMKKRINFEKEFMVPDTDINTGTEKVVSNIGINAATEKALTIIDEGGSCVIKEEIDVELFEENRSCAIKQEVHDNLAPETNLKFTDQNNIQWRRRSFYSRPIPFEEPAIADLGDKSKTPFDFFLNYFTEDLFEQFAFNTNLYTMQTNIGNFKPTNRNEIKILFGLQILIGSMKFPRCRLYWNQILGIQAFREGLSQDRFSQLRNNLHVVNNLDIPCNNTDKFIKIRPVIEAVRRRCLQLPVEESVCIDEQIIPYTGRLVTKQHIKGKPNTWGIKNFVLVGNSGQPYDFILYQGSSTGISASNITKFGLGASVVLHLTKRLVQKGHTIYFSNFFTTYQLLEILKELGHNAAGTIRFKRFANPPLITDQDLVKKVKEASDQVVSKDGGVVVVKWFDKKSVYLASNFIGMQREEDATKLNQELKDNESFKKPEIVQRYSFGMGGVDLLDQYIAYYRIFIKSRRWTLRIVTHFLDFALAASFLEYKKNAEKLGKSHNEIHDLLHFRLEVGNVLLQHNQRTSRSMKRSRSSESDSPTISIHSKRAMEIRPLQAIQYDGVDHLPQHDGKKEANRCKMNCKTLQGTAGRTHFQCIKCNVHLCITRERNCFLQFHTK